MTEQECREVVKLQDENRLLRDLLAQSFKHIGVEPAAIYEATEPVRKLKKRISKILKEGT
jgi:hypothetical protein